MVSEMVTDVLICTGVGPIRAAWTPVAVPVVVATDDSASGDPPDRARRNWSRAFSRPTTFFSTEIVDGDAQPARSVAVLGAVVPMVARGLFGTRTHVTGSNWYADVALPR